VQPRRPVPVLLVALAVAAAACSPFGGAPTPASSSGNAPSASSPAAGASASAASGVPGGTPITSSAASSAASRPVASGDPASVTVRLEPVVGGLDSPVLVTSSGDGSGRLFVLEQGGRIRIVRNGSLVAGPFLDLSGSISSGGERGLLGLAFHPGYGSAEARFYVDYTDPNGDTVIAEYRASADPDVADPASARSLLHIHQPFANHNGGWLAFGPDGDLYIGMGDGGSGGDPLGNGQRSDTLLGKLLRIDVDGTTVSTPYAIPADDPFVGRANARPEIWAYGLRNPWRSSFDRTTGDLWIGDVGQSRYEEVDHAARGTGAGADYGWNLMEGSHCYPSGDGCSGSGLVLPVTEYSHDAGDCAITGGYVYRGTAYPALGGVYLFGDFCTGAIRGLAAGGPDRQTPVMLAQTGRRLSSFGEDDAGELYVADLAGGEILRVVASPR
jgi:glucose/arabinose dehydrogenase